MPGKVQPAFGSGDVGDVSYPRLIGRLDFKFLLKQVLGNRERMVRVCRGLELFLLLAANAEFLAYSPDPMNPDMNALLCEIFL